MHWVVLIIKFIACIIAMFSTLLYLGSYINSLRESKALFTNKENMDAETRAAQLRIKLGLIMAIAWSVVIVL
jgi:hypothetical protein